MTDTLRIEYVALDELKRHPRNPKAHDLGAIHTSVNRFGYVNPILIDERTGWLVAGHGRLDTLAQMKAEGKAPPARIQVKGGEWYVPVIRGVSFNSDAEVEAYLVADNRLTELGGWNEPELAALLQDIANEDEKLLQATGYDSDDLQSLLDELTPPAPAEDKGVQFDRAAELQQQWQTERGQLWIIPSKSTKGEHRLLCGDSTNADDVARLCIHPVQGVFTSPPYAEQRKDQYGGIPSDEYVEWWDGIQSNVRRVLRDDGSFFVNIKPHCEDAERVLYVFDLVLAMKRQWGWAYIEEYCWLRSGVPKMVKYRFKNAFEPIYQFAVNARGFKFRPDAVRHYSEDIPKAGGPGVGNTNWAGKQGGPAARLQGITSHIFGTDEIESGLAYPSNVLKAWTNREALGHPAAFAVELPEFFMLAYSDAGDTWFDPFMGSGTVFVAAERNNRLAFGMEYLPEYCAIILQRMADMGLEPRLADGP